MTPVVNTRRRIYTPILLQLSETCLNLFLDHRTHLPELQVPWLTSLR